MRGRRRDLQRPPRTSINDSEPSSISMHMLNNYRFVTPVAMKKILGIGLAGELVNDFVAE